MIGVQHFVPVGTYRNSRRQRRRLDSLRPSIASAETVRMSRQAPRIVQLTFFRSAARGLHAPTARRAASRWPSRGSGGPANGRASAAAKSWPALRARKATRLRVNEPTTFWLRNDPTVFVGCFKPKLHRFLRISQSFLMRRSMRHAPWKFWNIGQKCAVFVAPEDDDLVAVFHDQLTPANDTSK